jgi:ParB family chromosome partitioning protein
VKGKIVAASSRRELANAGTKAKTILATPRKAVGSAPEMDLGLIDEDPNQPRTAGNPGFTATSMAELTATIKARGIKTPISIRYNPEAPGRYIINHGHRRYRGAKLAGRSTIPYFLDNDYNDADQVIENLQRNQLTPREIADYIGRELAKGLKKGEIAKSIGKSAAFVTQHVTLLDLPGPIASAFNTGRAKDVTVISELVLCFKTRPHEVTAWLEDETQEITRSSVKRLRDYLDERSQFADRDAEASGLHTDDQAGATETQESETPRLARARDRRTSPAIRVRHGKEYAQLLLQRRPSVDGHVWLQYESGGEEREVDLSKLRLVSIVEK